MPRRRPSKLKRMREADAAAAIEAVPQGSDSLLVRLKGDWLLHGEAPDSGEFTATMDRHEGIRRVGFDCSALRQWDATLLIGLNAMLRETRERGIEFDPGGLPKGAQRLLRLAGAVAPREDARRSPAGIGLAGRVGGAVLSALAESRNLARFIGELCFAAWRLLTGRAVFARRDLFLFLEQTGANALPIVSLIAFLVGVILAFVGVSQLVQFGAGIFVADLVAVAMVREMAAIMTGIILAGRSGAAFAAQIGTMKVNEEINALRTLGISPMDYLVLPRALALVLMMPLLAAYAGLMGMLGGGVVSLVMLDTSFTQYLEQTRNALDLNAVYGGLLKAAVFGVVIAISGCYQGMSCGDSAMAVGQATTAAVVMAILLIVVTASILTVIYTVFGI
jgi:phospholipid/cholesterol/gamma-HCH transport system permease protein